MAKTNNRTLPTLVITGKRTPKKTVAKADSMMVGASKRSVADVSKAVGKLNTSNTAKSYVKGINPTNPLKSSKTLGARGSASDLVNKVIDGGKKKK